MMDGPSPVWPTIEQKWESAGESQNFRHSQLRQNVTQFKLASNRASPFDSPTPPLPTAPVTDLVPDYLTLPSSFHGHFLFLPVPAGKHLQLLLAATFRWPIEFVLRFPFLYITHTITPK